MVFHDLIGNTPMLELSSLRSSATILLKIEKNNPGGSIKDRTVLGMMLDAERKGLLRKGMTIVEPTSGNTGIAISMLAASRGYRSVVFMPESASIERVKLMKAFGAKVIRTLSDKGISGSYDEAKSFLNSNPGSMMLDQFNNEANPLFHFSTTGPEMFRQVNRELDAFICGMGTGGTVTGIGRFLKKEVQSIHIAGIEPAGSPFISEGRSGSHRIQGIGPGFRPKVLDLSVLDEVITIEDEEALSMMRWLHKKEGLMVGISSGANVAGALKLAEKGMKRIATIAPDGYERYLSVDIS
ncbi:MULTISPECIES: cysteine synthase A [unclassified Mesotoga]|uniref:cysteine synthase A n=1 Tax=unclassified Mesotoga TaxID=1184398 RepID=UPI000DA6C1D1|nr:MULTISPECIES: cysteine synthase A [unclassified Mesotoga]PZC53030.1 cysteine synthase [Mesotoga sp. TolDC]HNU23101.1 cysteine synthase A [Mesotoga sp.]